MESDVTPQYGGRTSYLGCGVPEKDSQPTRDRVGGPEIGTVPYLRVPAVRSVHGRLEDARPVGRMSRRLLGPPRARVGRVLRKPVQLVEEGVRVGGDHGTGRLGFGTDQDGGLGGSSGGGWGSVWPIILRHSRFDWSKVRWGVERLPARAERPPCGSGQWVGRPDLGIGRRGWECPDAVSGTGKRPGAGRAAGSGRVTGARGGCVIRSAGAGSRARARG